jgi:cullin-associated NEDD8-dissociated protein 1
MAPFHTDHFLKDIKHVDKDLRLMALFDLRRFLPSAEENSIPNEVVEKTLACLSLDERCEEVQNEAAGVLPTMVVKCRQRDVILQHLLVCTTEAPQSAESEAENLHYLCGMAFKKSCAEFADEARRNVFFWQRQLNTARALCKSCAANLSASNVDEATKEIMYNAINAIVSAYRDALDDRAALITRAVQDFQSAASIRHASLTLVESLIVFVDTATQEKVLSDSTALLLGAKADEHYVAYLQLCEAELKALRVPPQPMLQKVLDSVCSHLRHTVEHYDGAEDSSEVLLEVLDSLLQLGMGGDCSADWQTSFSAINDLISFDPYYANAEAEQTGGGYGDDGYDDDFDEYYDYNNGVSDSTWRLRMRAVHVLQTLVTQHNDIKLAVTALTVAAGTLQDRVELVQLEGVKLIRAVTRCTCVRDANGIDLITCRCKELCGLLACGGEKVLTSVVKALEEVFDVFADVSALTDAVMPLLLMQVQANAECFASNIGVVEGLRSVVANVVNAAGAHPPTNVVVRLSTQLPVLCSSGARSETAAAGIVRVSQTLACVYAATHDTAIPDALGREYSALAGNAAVPNGCRAAAVDCLARWIASCGFQLFQKPSAALWAALDTDALRLPALRALYTIASSDISAAAVPAPVMQTVEAFLSSAQPSNVRLAAVDVLLGRLSLLSVAPLDAAQLHRLTQLYAPGHPLSLASCELGEMRQLARLLIQLFQHTCSAGSTVVFYKPYVAPMWGHLAQLASAVAFSRSLMDAALEGVTMLLTAVYARETAARAVMEQDVADFLTRDQAHLTCSYTLVRCIASETINDFLASLSTRIAGNGHFLLCVGEAGRENTLETRWCEMLLDSVGSKQGEEMRTCGEVALSYSMLCSANVSTILLPCGQRAADSNVVGRYYYVKAMKEAATLALSRHNTAFHEPAICEKLLATFLGAAAGAELEELYGACVGVLSAFLVDGRATPRIADILSNEGTSLDTRITCMVALRYFLSTLVERGASVEAYRAVVIQALLQLKRPVNAKDSTAPSLPLRSMALRLLTSVLQRRPQWLLCEETRATIFPNLLTELHEDGTLQGTIDLSGYTHRVDKGLECRKLAFESLSTVFWVERQHNVDLLTFCDAKSQVVDALIVACSAHNKGDRDSFINDTAKELLMRFVESNPGYTFTEAQLDALIDKLSRDIKSGASSTDAQKTTLLFTVKCVMRLSSIPAFAYHEGFQEVAEVARTSGLLSQSLKI